MKTLLLLSILLACSVIYQGCKTDSPGNTGTLTLDKPGYAALELAQWNATGLTFSQDTFQAFIDNSIMVTAIRVDTSLLFVLPPLGFGSHSIKVTINDQFFLSYFSNVDITPVVPDTYLQAILAEFTLLKNYLNQRLDSLPATEQAQLQNDINTIQGYVDQAMVELNGISDTEKQYAIDILQANRIWINNVVIAAAKVKLDVDALVAGTPNFELKAIDAVKSYNDGKNFVLGQAPKMITWTYSDQLITDFFPGIGTGSGAGAGARIALALLLGNLDKLNLAAAELLDVPFVPFQNMAVEGNTDIEFNNGEAKDLSVTMDYRTPYTDDNNSNVALLNLFADGMVKLNAQWDGVVIRFSTPLQLSPFSIEDLTSYDTQNRNVHSDYLSITDISNTSIADSIDRTNGIFRVLFTSTDTTSNIDFNFKVKYSSELGSFEHVTDALLKN